MSLFETTDYITELSEMFGFVKVDEDAAALLVLGQILSGVVRKVALVGPSRNHTRSMMVRQLMELSPHSLQPAWLPAKGTLLWPNGVQAFVYSDEKPDAFCGPEHDIAWVHGVMYWVNPKETLEWMLMGLGRHKNSKARSVVSG